MDNLSYSSLPKIALKSDRLGSWQKLGSTTVEFLIYDRYVFKRLPTRSSLVGEDARSEIFSWMYYIYCYCYLNHKSLGITGAVTVVYSI